MYVLLLSLTISASNAQSSPYSAFSAGLPCSGAPWLSPAAVHRESLRVAQATRPDSPRRALYDGGVRMCEAWYATLQGKGIDDGLVAAAHAVERLDSVLADPMRSAGDADDATFWRALALLFADRGAGLAALKAYAHSFPNGRWLGDAWVWIGDVEACGCGCLEVSVGGGRVEPQRYRAAAMAAGQADPRLDRAKATCQVLNMGWANNAIEALREGRHVTIKPHGGSMRPLVESGATVTLEPCLVADVRVGDVLLCRVAGNVYLHLATAVEGAGDDKRIQIGNKRGRINGWTKAVYGRAVEIINPQFNVP